MLERLRRIVVDAADRRNKLILVVGPHGSGKTALLVALGAALGRTPWSLGAALGPLLALIPQTERPLKAATLLRQLAEAAVCSGLRSRLVLN